MTLKITKFKTQNSNIECKCAMTEIPGKPKFDLEERTFVFARDIRAFIKTLPRTICNLEDVRQLVRSSGSIGANYIEANEALGPKDFRMRMRIARKEAKETRYWLKLLDTRDFAECEVRRRELIQESTELLLIFSSILSKLNVEN
jgi:four helix bundle protein